MSAIHLHLLIVHLPVVACPIALVLLVLGHGLDRMLLVRVGYALILVAAASGIVAYYSGPPAYDQLSATLAGDKPWVEQHAVVARLAFVGLVLLGVVTTQVVLREAQGDEPQRWVRFAILGATALLCYALAWTAHLGGQIRHVEIRQPEWRLFPHLGIDAADPTTDPSPHPDG